ncbi:MAG TPA: hypothetical protein VF669_03610 [Tepidisphaeraceae bacterium]|jgi:hypothetical protein
MRLTPLILTTALLAGCASQPHRQPTTRPSASDAVAGSVRATEANLVQERRETPEQRKIRLANEQVLANLQKPLPELKFSGTALAEAIDQFRNRTGLSIFVDWKSLEKIGLKRDLPVTCRLTNLTARDGLNKLLIEIGSDRVSLDYVIDEGILTISTKDQVSRNTITRVYDVRDGITAPAGPERDKQVAAIIRKVQGIHPLTWRSQGGISGAVQELSGQLIVTATPDIHQQVIDELMAEHILRVGSDHRLMSAGSR